MRRLLTSALVFTLACGGPTGPDPEPTGTPSLAIVSGDNQTVQVTDTLPFDAVVRVERGGEPVADQLVDWRVLEDNAGEPFVTTTRTDSEGVTKNRVVAGTRAFTHPDMDGSAHMEVRWVEQSSGEAIVDTTITFRVLTGEIEFIERRTCCNVPEVAIGGPLDLLTLFVARDQYGNPTSDGDASRLAVDWEYVGSYQAEEGRGPSGSGWDAGPVPELHRFGWYERARRTVDTTVAEPNWPEDTLQARGAVEVTAPDLGTTTNASASAHLEVRVPACWEETSRGDDTHGVYETTPWSADCPKPWEGS